MALIWRELKRSRRDRGRDRGVNIVEMREREGWGGGREDGRVGGVRGSGYLSEMRKLDRYGVKSCFYMYF